MAGVESSEAAAEPPKVAGLDDLISSLNTGDFVMGGHRRVKAGTPDVGYTGLCFIDYGCFARRCWPVLPPNVVLVLL